MDFGNLGRKELGRLLAAISLVFLWILLPLYSQQNWGVSAIKVSFAVTVIYYLGFRLWKFVSGKG